MFIGCFVERVPFEKNAFQVLNSGGCIFNVYQRANVSSSIPHPKTPTL